MGSWLHVLHGGASSHGCCDPDHPEAIPALQLGAEVEPPARDAVACVAPAWGSAWLGTLLAGEALDMQPASASS